MAIRARLATPIEIEVAIPMPGSDPRACDFDPSEECEVLNCTGPSVDDENPIRVH